MSRIVVTALSMALCMYAVLPTQAVAMAVGEAMTSAEVIALGAEGDGQTVTVRGEALGEMTRDGRDGAWVNVLSDGVALGLWGAPGSFEPITRYGDYHWRGDIVEATGVFNAACDQHGGDRDVHIELLKVVEAAEPIDRPLQPWKLISGLAMAGAAGALWLRYRQRSQRAF